MRRITRFVAFGYFLVVLATAALQLLGVAQFSAPFNIIPAPQRPPVVVTIAYSSEQREWLAAASQQFAASGPTVRGRPIQIVLREQASLAIVDNIVGGQSQPTAIIPASSSQLSDLSRSNAAQVASGANAPTPVALSPLVLIGWKERTSLLFPAGTQDTWGRLHEALQKTNWSELDGNTNWGPVKLGHASPLKSNSGLEALLLMAYAYQKKATGLTAGDVNSEGFQTWLKEIEQGVTDFPNLPDSSDAMFNAFVQKGASAYDVAVMYESQVVRGMRRIQQLPAVQVIYPPATTISDHPFAILDAAWVKPEEQEAARLFRDFLLGEPAQRLGRQYGFRPANAAVALDENDPNNPFPDALSAGVQHDLPGTVAAPAPDVLDALRNVWRKQAGQ